MFGVWGETLKNWKSELEEAVKLPVNHISCYSLTYEKGTPLFKALVNKSIRPIEDDQASAMYEMAMELLSVRGFKQYEISNFAKDENYRCRHNLSYWENNPYVGLGASAVSYIDGVRAKNASDIQEYIKRYQAGASLIDSSEKLSPLRRAKETAAIKIRTRDGIDFKWFAEKTGYDLQKLERNALSELTEKDLIKYKREGNSLIGIALKHRGILFCDTVSSALL
jgi:oxygen-independent coproporphyrinogen-3 oxidase